jgi:hypothetical protein
MTGARLVELCYTVLIINTADVVWIVWCRTGGAVDRNLWSVHLQTLMPLHPQAPFVQHPSGQVTPQAPQFNCIVIEQSMWLSDLHSGGFLQSWRREKAHLSMDTPRVISHLCYAKRSMYDDACDIPDQAGCFCTRPCSICRTRLPCNRCKHPCAPHEPSESIDGPEHVLVLSRKVDSTLSCWQCYRPKEPCGATENQDHKIGGRIYSLFERQMTLLRLGVLLFGSGKCPYKDDSNRKKPKTHPLRLPGCVQWLAVGSGCPRTNGREEDRTTAPDFGSRYGVMCFWLDCHCFCRMSS